jgi:hypothetical protein
MEKADVELIRAELEELKSLMEEINIPSRNLIQYTASSKYSEQLCPKSLHKKYLELMKLANEKYPSDGSYKVWTYLGQEVRIDPERKSPYYLWDVMVEAKPGLAQVVYPEISELEDTDGLVELPFGGFEYKGNYLIFDNSFSKNYFLTEWLMGNWKGEFTLRVPLDNDAIGLSDSIRCVDLKAHWWGPKNLSKVAASFDDEVAVFGGAAFQGKIQDRTEIFFKRQDGKRVIEIEELIPMDGLTLSIPTSYKGTTLNFVTRYIHAIVSEDLNTCFHLDGAYRDYSTKEEFLKRNMTMDLKNTNIKQMCVSHKVFRIDSEQGFANFPEIIGLFFTYNPYISQFFEGKNQENTDMEKRRTQLLGHIFTQLAWL